MIHIVNGDVLGEKIKHIKGKIIVWREMYDWGPLKQNVLEQCLEFRAKYFEDTIGIPSKQFTNGCIAQEDELNSITSSDEVTLWFEHDRYDQTMLIYILNRLKEKSLKSLNIVSIDSHHSLSHFKSLGQLLEKDLEILYEERLEVSKKQIEDASKAWGLYTSEDPRPLLKWLENNEISLPFFKRAMETHFTFFPHPVDGLNKIERESLKLIQKESLSFKNLFDEISNLGLDDGLTNLQFAAILANLTPLIQVDNPLPRFNENSNPDCSITELGNRVLLGKCNRVEESSINWWLGGVHLTNSGWFFGGNKFTKRN